MIGKVISFPLRQEENGILNAVINLNWDNHAFLWIMDIDNLENKIENCILKSNRDFLHGKLSEWECVHVCVCVCILSHVQLFATPCAVTYQAPLPMEFSKQDYWSDFQLQGILLTQGLNPTLLGLLNWQADFLPSFHLGSPQSGRPNYIYL